MLNFNHQTKQKRGEEMYTYSKLRGRIIEKYGTLSRFAKAINLSQTSLSAKMTCKTGLSQEDMDKWAELLDIKLAEYGDYFFT